MASQLLYATFSLEIIKSQNLEAIVIAQIDNLHCSVDASLTQNVS